MADADKTSREQPPSTSSSPSEKPSDGEVSGDSDDQKVGWIEGLAERSTGLPGTSRATKPNPEEKSPWRYAGLGLQFAGTSLLFVWFGYMLDNWMGWTPWGLVSLGMLGVIGGLYLLIKEVIKENADEPPKASREKK
jgi:ATP synthase protein I